LKQTGVLRAADTCDVLLTGRIRFESGALRIGSIGAEVERWRNPSC